MREKLDKLRRSSVMSMSSGKGSSSEGGRGSVVSVLQGENAFSLEKEQSELERERMIMGTSVFRRPS